MPPSNHQGMGALPFDGGTAFRVWAPNAKSVSVAGIFNDWNPTNRPLTFEGYGIWSGDVAGAGIGDQYKFVLTTAAAETLWKNDPYARSMTNSVGKSIITDPGYRWTAGDYKTPAFDELLIYELHVGSFVFDPTAQSRRGTFASVISRLDYIRDLGFNAIQILPVDEFPGDISMGYNPSTIFAIEESYGGPNGLRQLVDEAHKRGIAVIFDVVYNHLGPSDLDLWRFDGWSEGDGGGIYFYNDWRRRTPWGDTRPDYGRGEVRGFLRDNALLWLEDRQCDGLRWDATVFIRRVDGPGGGDLPDGWSLMTWINAEIRARQPWKITIAEDMQDEPWVTKAPDEGGAGFGAQWGARFMHTLRSTLAAPYDASRDMHAIADIIGQRYNGRAFQRVNYTESHDEVAATNGNCRLPELIWPGNAESWAAQKRSTLGAALVFTAPGIPMIFMGQEFLTWGAWSDANELDWSRGTHFPGITALYRDLAHLRRNWFATTEGLKGENISVFHVNDADKVVAFHRWSRGGARDDVVVIANFSSRAFDHYEIGLPRGGAWYVRFNSDWNGYSSVFGNAPSFDFSTTEPGRDGMPASGGVGIGPYTAIILSQDD